jgi:hypothetical protein
MGDYYSPAFYPNSSSKKRRPDRLLSLNDLRHVPPYALPLRFANVATVWGPFENVCDFDIDATAFKL